MCECTLWSSSAYVTRRPAASRPFEGRLVPCAQQHHNAAPARAAVGEVLLKQCPWPSDVS